MCVEYSGHSFGTLNLAIATILKNEITHLFYRNFKKLFNLWHLI